MSIQSEIATIVLAYKRLPELVEDEHLFSASISLQDGEGSVVFQRSLADMEFHKMMTEVSRDLRESPDAHVVLQRTERSGIAPMVLEEDTRVLLRDDPVQAIAAMNIKSGSKAGGTVVRSAPSPFDDAAEEFGLRVFVRMRNGMFEDPVTGTWKTVAYSSKGKCWLIRADNNKSETWLEVGIPSLSLALKVDDMEAVGAELAKSCWATVKVEDVLQQNTNKFFLPRRWNTHGQWIGRTELRKLLDEYNNRKDES